MEERGEYLAGTDLTGRELEVLKCLAIGMTGKCIAVHFGIARRTVSYHQFRICGKLGAVTLPHAVNIAWERGLLRPDANDREK